MSEDEKGKNSVVLPLFLPFLGMKTALYNFFQKKRQKGLLLCFIRNIIIQVLFTLRGERIGRKRFLPARKREVATRPDALPWTSVTEKFSWSYVYL